MAKKKEDGPGFGFWLSVIGNGVQVLDRYAKDQENQVLRGWLDAHARWLKNANMENASLRSALADAHSQLAQAAAQSAYDQARIQHAQALRDQCQAEVGMLQAQAQEYQGVIQELQATIAQLGQNEADAEAAE